MDVDLLSRMKMDHAMRLGVEQGQFRLVYQPQVSLLDGRLLGAEALARWHDKDLGEVAPSVFIDLAEETGFIIAVGNWVLHRGGAAGGGLAAGGSPGDCLGQRLALRSFSKSTLSSGWSAPCAMPTCPPRCWSSS